MNPVHDKGPDFAVVGPLRRGWVGAITLLVLWSAGARAADDDDDDKTPPLPKAIAEVAQKYAGVTEWQGFFDSATSGTTSWGNPNFSITGVRQLEARSSGRFTLKRNDDAWSPKRGEFSWVIEKAEPGQASGTEHDQFSQQEGYSGQNEEWRKEISGTVAMLGTEFAINLTKQSAQLHPGHSPEEQQPQGTRTGQKTVQVSGSDGQRKLVTQPIDETFRGAVRMWMARPGSTQDRENALREWAAVQNGPAVLVFSYTSAGVYASGDHPPRCEHRSRVWLVPVYDDLEVEVTIDGYAKWRPEGSIAKPNEPGNSLIARATLKSKTGKTKELPAVKRFRFHLLDTSREPGVCLNWPLDAKDADYDLRLASESGGTLTDAEQKLSVPNPPQDEQGRPYALAKIASYDFGGRATLEVVCELEDGREIMGLMKDEKGQDDLIRLPKMSGPDWIAESWRKEKKAEKAAALDDNEKIDGQHDNGDGYTLYEEYRGWAVNGRHVEGDAAKKDFFVLNLFQAKAEAQPGINLFAAVSKLNVHSRLRRSEMSEKTRLMNGNHRDAPHRVDQHGVWVKVFPNVAELGGAGAYTPMTKAGVSGRPGITIGVGLLARGNVENELTQPFNRPARDMILAFDRGLAHELLHSVGVEHHGTGDGTISLKWVSPRHPRNKVGRPHFAEMLSSDSSPFTVLDENGHDVATQYMIHYAADRVNVETMFKARFQAEGEAYVAGHAGQTGLAWNSAAEYVEYFLEEAVSSGFAFRAAKVGRPHGEHSGDQDCLMRYYFAEFYPAIGKERTYYKVTPGTERTGIDICHSRAGTGVNLPKPPGLPQSRYSDAPSDAGDCFAQICPNDAIPPRILKK